MMAFMDTFVCVHKGESWTHRNKRFKLACQEEGFGAERYGRDGRSWKRRWCRELRCRESLDDTM